MTIDESRNWVRQVIADGDTSGDYEDEEIDRAILYAGNRFVREARYGRTVSDVALTASDESPDISALVTAGWHPERVISVLISGQEERLSVVDYEQLNAIRAEGTVSGNPQYVAFTSNTTMEVYPTPSAAVTMKMIWYPPFTSWTPGGSGAATINVPDELLIPVLQDGAAAALLVPNPDELQGSISWQRFVEWSRRQQGAGSISGNYRLQPPHLRRRFVRRIDSVYEGL